MKRFPFFIAVVLTLLASGVRADQFVSGQSADVVLGQSSFTSGFEAIATAADRFDRPISVAVDPTTGKVFVADSDNNRILRFSSAAAALSGSSAESVIGQVNFTANLSNQGGATGASTLSNPRSITIDSQGRLWVVDNGNNRVLCFFAASFRPDFPPADRVFGQTLFTTATTGTTASTMSGPIAVCIGSDDTLWVADFSNRRVLRFANISSKSNGEAANGVLGQVDFNSSVSATTASNFRSPISVSADHAGRLWVADSSDNRVLRFDNAATVADANGAPANAVLGQTVFDSSTNALFAAGLNFPFCVLATRDGTVWVCDSSNSRVLGFRNAAAKPNGGAADVVLGQPDFLTATPGPTANLMTSPAGLSTDTAGRLWVVERFAHRAIRFSPIKSPTITITTRASKTPRASLIVRGRASGPTTRVTFRVGTRGAFRKARGTSSWNFTARLKKGRNVVSVIAEGPGGRSPARKITVTRT